MTEGESLRFAYGAAWFSEVGSPRLWKGYFSKVDAGGWARQAECLGGFEKVAEDLEKQVLPAVVALADWPRFLRYALIAANLRSLAESLAEEEILVALVEGGQRALAEGIADGVADPLERARARAALAAALPRHSAAFGTKLGELREDLEGSIEARTEDQALRRGRVLGFVAQRLGPELRGCWEHWIDPLASWPEAAAKAWSGVAVGFLGAGERDDAVLWRSLSELSRLGVWSDALQAALRGACSADPWGWLERLHGAAGLSAHRVWCFALGLLAERSVVSSMATDRSWGQVRQALPQPEWTLELLEAGRETWARLPALGLDELSRHLPSEELGTVLHLLVFEASGAHRFGEQIDQLLSRLADSPLRLHWELRCLSAQVKAGFEARQLQPRLGAIEEAMARARHGVAVEDLARYLDLVAVLSPKDLRWQLEDALSRSAATAAALLRLAELATEVRVLRQLITGCEGYAMNVAADQGEGFELRSRLVLRATVRCCLLEGDLGALQMAGEHLLPEEEDALRAELAPALVAQGLDQAAFEVADGVGDPRLQLLARLRASRSGSVRSEWLTPESLYAAVARTDRLRDELGAARALAASPWDPRAVAAQHLASFHGRTRQIEALLDLARHALALHSELPPSRQDRLAAILPLRAELGVIESEDWLVGITPELVEVGCRAAGRRALAELQEGTVRVLKASVAWERRLEAFEGILACLRELIQETPRQLPEGLARTYLTWLWRLPESEQLGREGETVRRRWVDVTSRAIAFANSLPEAERQGLARTSSFSAAERWLDSPPEIDPVALDLPRRSLDRSARRLARLGSASSPADRCWLAVLRSALARGEIPPHSPVERRIRRRLGELPPSVLLPALAGAVIRALDRGGRQPAEQALALWLDAAVGYRMVAREGADESVWDRAIDGALALGQTSPAPMR
ncbi:MAG TPA: hypothetical protein VF017_18400 [Thermoanaerobaculia bacterium]|nr:hypothetical protein [Thermoanaerobaculia bacterium]